MSDDLISNVIEVTADNHSGTYASMADFLAAHPHLAPPPATCATCRWWVDQEGERVEYGECHRFPPRSLSDSWAVVQPDDFCGEHAARPQ